MGERGRIGGLEHLTAATTLSSPTLRDLLFDHDFQTPQRSPGKGVRRSPSPFPPLPGGSSGRKPVLGECIKKRNILKIISDGRSSKPCTTRSTARKSGVIQKQLRRTPGRLFFITVSLPHLSPTVRSNFVGYFENLTSYCSCVEESRQLGTVTHHLHCFLEFEEKQFVDDIRSCVAITDNSSFISQNKYLFSNGD